MLTRTRSFTPLLVALTAPALLAGCLDSTVVGGEGGGGASGDGAVVAVTSGTSGTGGANGASATAHYGSALPEAYDPCSTFTCSGNGDDMLFLFVDSLGSTCAAPRAPETQTGNSWDFVIGVPRAFQEVGTHAVDETFIIGASETMNPPGGPSVGSSTGGVGASGVLEILAMDETTIRFSVAGFTHSINRDGEYVATRCGTAPGPEGIALSGDQLSGDEASGGGAPAADDAITIVVGDTVAGCDMPLMDVCSGGPWQVAVTLPADYQTPGVYSLSDPRIASENCTDLPKFLGGTIEVVAIDATSMIVRFADVVDHVDELEQDLLIARCL